MSAQAVGADKRSCADGPALVRWLESLNVRFSDLTPAQQRAVQRWRGGMQAQRLTVDALLLDLDLLREDVPSWVWRSYDNGRLGVQRSRRA